jgi:hypothetical protein
MVQAITLADVRLDFDAKFDQLADDLDEAWNAEDAQLIARIQERIDRMVVVRMIVERMLDGATGSPVLVRCFVSLLMQDTLETFKQRENKYTTRTGKCFHTVEHCGNCRSSVPVQHAPLGLNPCKRCIQA